MAPSTFSVSRTSTRPPVFAALLDQEHGGYFALQPRGDEYSSKQMYLPDTNILLTRFLAETSIVELIDFMTISEDGEPQRLIRMAHVIRGTVEFDWECRPALNYARDKLRTVEGDNFIVFAGHSDAKVAVPSELESRDRECDENREGKWCGREVHPAAGSVGVPCL
jgi:GH15 family glucan-1,4-alpha-glucosidase